MTAQPLFPFSLPLGQVGPSADAQGKLYTFRSLRSLQLIDFSQGGVIMDVVNAEQVCICINSHLKAKLVTKTCHG